MLMIGKSTYIKILQKLSGFKKNNKEMNCKNIRTDDILLMQMKGSEFRRLDIIVRILFIEQYFGKNDIGFRLYSEMQNKRSDGQNTGANERFIELIKSFQSNSYDKTSTIEVDQNLQLYDGSHRIALCEYFNVDEVSIRILPEDDKVEYSIDWFISHDFGYSDIEAILLKAKEVSDSIKPTTMSFIVWPALFPFLDSVRKDLSFYGKIVEEKIYKYRNFEEFSNIVRLIYSCDDISVERIEEKLSHMKGQCPQICEISLRVDEINYRIKSASNFPISITGERIKRVIRSKYENKVKNYYFDILFHSSDNLEQCKYIGKILESDIEMNDILSVVSKFDYVIIKNDVPYMPVDFPNHIPLGKDLDVLCRNKDISIICDDLLSTLKPLKDYYEVLKCKDNENKCRIRIEKNGYLFFQIDIASELVLLSKNFVDDCIDNRRDLGVFFSDEDRFEYVVRLQEIMCNPQKKHHREWISEHSECYSEILCEKYCNFDYKKLL